MAPFFTGAILLLDIERVLFSIFIKLLVRHVTSRDQYQALRLATVVHVIKSTPLRHHLPSFVENFIPNQIVTVKVSLGVYR